MTKATIIGNTSWGSALAVLLNNKGTETRLWVRSDAEAEALNHGIHSYSSTSQIEEAVIGADLIIWAVPSQTLRQNVAQTRDYLSKSMLLVSAAKGLEMNTGKRMSQVMAEEITTDLKRQICVLSGPNLAKEIAHDLPAAAMIAAQDIAVAERAKELIEAPNFILFASDDITGVELSGALKNIVALGAGMIDGLGLGNNAKGAFITLVWTELVSLGVTLGARADTFYGLAGLGDMIATCSSIFSRNHHVGYELAKGLCLDEISASMSQVAEGVTTTITTHELAKTRKLELPLTTIIHRILFEDLPVSQARTEFEKLIVSYKQASLKKESSHNLSAG